VIESDLDTGWRYNVETSRVVCSPFAVKLYRRFGDDIVGLLDIDDGGHIADNLEVECIAGDSDRRLRVPEVPVVDIGVVSDHLVSIIVFVKIVKVSNVFELVEMIPDGGR
jgi:hypothetical protein